MRVRLALTDGYLLDLLTTASRRHRLDLVVGLIMNCMKLGAVAEQVGVVDKCLQTITESWLLPSKYSR